MNDIVHVVPVPSRRRRMGRFSVSAELLLSGGIPLPAGTTLYNIVRHEFRPDEFIFYVEHPDLPEMLEGGLPVNIFPTFRRLESGAVEFVGWGIQW